MTQFLIENSIGVTALAAFVFLATYWNLKFERPRRRITEGEIRQMSLEQIVDFLEDTPIIERNGPLWALAGECGLPLMNDSTEVVLKERYWGIVANGTPATRLAIRATRRFHPEAVGA